MAANIIQADSPMKDGCPLSSRSSVFMIDEGVRGVAEHVFRDSNGNPIDISFDDEMVLEDGQELPSVEMRVSEVTGTGCSPSPIYQIKGSVFDGENGISQIPIPPEVSGNSGIYQASIGYLNEDSSPMYIDNVLFSVERTLFGIGVETGSRPGTPTIQEIRTQILDFSEDNSLLEDVEFTNDQIISAIFKPIEEFNNCPPPLSHFSTKTFPWRNEWINATIGYLYQFGAAHYRRNKLNTSGGGLKLDDKDKENEYMRASQLALSEWREWMQRKKIEINGRGFMRTYGGLTHRGW